MVLGTGGGMKRQPMSRERQLLAPLGVLAGKQSVGQEDSDLVALPVLLHLDAAKRGQGPAVGQQHLYLHLLTAQILSVWLQKADWYKATVAGCEALMKASKRPTKLLDLSTSEYKAIREALGRYLRILPYVEVGMFSRAAGEAERLMNS